MGFMLRIFPLKSLVLVFVFTAVLMPAAAWPAEKAVLNLDECIKRALKVNADVKGAEFDVEVYRSKKSQADAARFPQVDLVAYGSLSPRARLADTQGQR